MNDSVWMIPQPVTWFEAARALEVDFAGATCHHGVARADMDDFRSLQWQYDTGRRKYHVASYAWSIGPNVLRSRDFVRFWQGLDIRNDKRRTVRRGEVGFSRWVLRKGFSHGVTWAIDTLDRELAELSDREIHQIAREVIVREDPRLQVPKAEVIDGGAGPT